MYIVNSFSINMLAPDVAHMEQDELDKIFNNVEAKNPPGGVWEEASVVLRKGSHSRLPANIYYPGDGRGFAVILSTGEVTEDYES